MRFVKSKWYTASAFENYIDTCFQNETGNISGGEIEFGLVANRGVETWDSCWTGWRNPHRDTMVTHGPPGVVKQLTLRYVHSFFRIETNYYPGKSDWGRFPKNVDFG